MSNLNSNLFPWIFFVNDSSCSETIPVIVQPLRHLRCCDGDAVTFECRIQDSSTGTLNIRWEKGGKVMKRSTLFHWSNTCINQWGSMVIDVVIILVLSSCSLMCPSILPIMFIDSRTLWFVCPLSTSWIVWFPFKSFFLLEQRN